MLEPWSCEIYGEVARVEAGQVGKEVKEEMFLRFAYQIHIAREILYLREKPSLLDES